MRRLVTGGAGYLDSIVAQRLLERGDEVTILDSLYRGHRSAIPDDAEFEQVDLLDRDETRRVLRFAALALIAEPGALPPRQRAHVAEPVRRDARGRRRRLVFSSTCAAHGDSRRVPIDESAGLHGPRDPRSRGSAPPG